MTIRKIYDKICDAAANGNYSTKLECVSCAEEESDEEEIFYMFVELGYNFTPIDGGYIIDWNHFKDGPPHYHFVSDFLIVFNAKYMNGLTSLIRKTRN